MRRPIVAVAGGDPTTIERQGGYEKTPNVHVFTNLRDSVQLGSRGRPIGRPDRAGGQASVRGQDLVVSSS